ncbi:MAG: hypothetical protein GY725_00070 [bacterium]|nr:hypothetical protein [bacterium]
MPTLAGLALSPLMVGVGLLGGLFFAHLALWRVWVPRRPTLVLLGIFFGGLVAGLVGCLALGWLEGPWPVLQVLLFHGSFSLAYVVAYSGIEATSPSLAIARAVRRAGPKGCTYVELSSLVNDRAYLEPRLRALENSGAVLVDQDSYRLSPQGMRWARLMKIASDVFLNLPKGS